MSIVISAGGIVLKNENGSCKMGLIKHFRSDKYVFPKGHVEPGETFEQTALREVKEELGLSNIKLIKYLGKFYRDGLERTGEVVDKEIHIYLMTTDGLNSKSAEEDYVWIELSEAENLLNTEEKDFFNSVKFNFFPSCE